MSVSVAPDFPLSSMMVRGERELHSTNVYIPPPIAFGLPDDQQFQTMTVKSVKRLGDSNFAVKVASTVSTPLKNNPILIITGVSESKPYVWNLSDNMEAEMPPPPPPELEKTLPIEDSVVSSESTSSESDISIESVVKFDLYAVDMALNSFLMRFDLHRAKVSSRKNKYYQKELDSEIAKLRKSLRSNGLDDISVKDITNMLYTGHQIDVRTHELFSPAYQKRINDLNGSFRTVGSNTRPVLVHGSLIQTSDKISLYHVLPETSVLLLELMYGTFEQYYQRLEELLTHYFVIRPRLAEHETSQFLDQTMEDGTIALDYMESSFGGVDESASNDRIALYLDMARRRSLQERSKPFIASNKLSALSTSPYLTSRKKKVSEKSKNSICARLDRSTHSQHSSVSVNPPRLSTPPRGPPFQVNRKPLTARLSNVNSSIASNGSKGTSTSVGQSVLRSHEQRSLDASGFENSLDVPRRFIDKREVMNSLPGSNKKVDVSVISNLSSMNSSMMGKNTTLNLTSNTSKLTEEKFDLRSKPLTKSEVSARRAILARPHPHALGLMPSMRGKLNQSSNHTSTTVVDHESSAGVKGDDSKANNNSEISFTVTNSFSDASSMANSNLLNKSNNQSQSRLSEGRSHCQNQTIGFSLSSDSYVSNSNSNSNSILQRNSAVDPAYLVAMEELDTLQRTKLHSSSPKSRPHPSVSNSKNLDISLNDLHLEQLDLEEESEIEEDMLPSESDLLPSNTHIELNIPLTTVFQPSSNSYPLKENSPKSSVHLPPDRVVLQGLVNRNSASSTLLSAPPSMNIGFTQSQNSHARPSIAQLLDVSSKHSRQDSISAPDTVNSAVEATPVIEISPFESNLQFVPPIISSDNKPDLNTNNSLLDDFARKTALFLSGKSLIEENQVESTTTTISKPSQPISIVEPRKERVKHFAERRTQLKKSVAPSYTRDSDSDITISSSESSSVNNGDIKDKLSVPSNSSLYESNSSTSDVSTESLESAADLVSKYLPPTSSYNQKRASGNISTRENVSLGNLSGINGSHVLDFLDSSESAYTSQTNSTTLTNNVGGGDHNNSGSAHLNSTSYADSFEPSLSSGRGNSTVNNNWDRQPHDSDELEESEESTILDYKPRRLGTNNFVFGNDESEDMDVLDPMSKHKDFYNNNDEDLDDF